MEDITSEQQEKIRQFQEVTNIDDQGVALATLASLNWNLEGAIMAQLTEGQHMEPEPSHAARALDVTEEISESLPSSSRSYMTRSRAANMERAPRAELATAQSDSSSRTNGRVYPAEQDEMDIESSDDDDDDEFINNLDGHDLDAALHDEESRLDNSLPLIPSQCDSPTEAVHNFVAVFDSRFAKNGTITPTFFCGHLATAAREAFECPERAVSERRPLAIYLHNDSSIANNIFPGLVLCSEAVTSLLRAQFVLWPWDVTRNDNLTKLKAWMADCNMGNMFEKKLHAIAQILQQVTLLCRKTDDYPVLLMIVKEGPNVHLSELAKGQDTVDTVVRKLLRVVEQYGEIRMRAAQTELERKDRERIRQEQAEEYERSLAADRARVEEKERVIREQKEAELQEQQQKAEEEREREKLKDELPSEPEEGAEAVSVKFRLPGGGQVTEMNSECTFQELNWPKREQIFVEER